MKHAPGELSWRDRIARTIGRLTVTLPVRRAGPGRSSIGSPQDRRQHSVFVSPPHGGPIQLRAATRSHRLQVVRGSPIDPDQRRTHPRSKARPPASAPAIRPSRSSVRQALSSRLRRGAERPSLDETLATDCPPEVRAYQVRSTTVGERPGHCWWSAKPHRFRRKSRNGFDGRTIDQRGSPAGLTACHPERRAEDGRAVAGRGRRDPAVALRSQPLPLGPATTSAS